VARCNTLPADAIKFSEGAASAASAASAVRARVMARGCWMSKLNIGLKLLLLLYLWMGAVGSL
jgi:hypothetical protein